jgi:Tfp pilus assembly protein PilN
VMHIQLNFMTEQQEHLANLLQQRQQLSQELESLQGQATSKRELFFKVQGVVEYLTQLGVVLPEPEDLEEPVEEVSEEY